MNNKALDLLLEKPAARRLAAQTSLTFFARYYLSNHVRTPLSELHKEWAYDLTHYDRIAKAAPRGHAKSSWHTVIYPLWCILFKKKKFIVLIADSSTQAQEYLGTIIEELETNEKIIKDFGKIAGYIPPASEDKKKWTAKDIVTTTGVKVVAKGWGTRMRGLRFREQRPDLIIIDDAENDQSVQSEEQREKTKSIFNKSILNLGDPTTQIIVVGTILHFASLLMGLLNDPPPGWYTKMYKAYKDNGEPLWPEWWSKEQLEAKRAEIGGIAFEQEYMNNPLDPATQILKPTAFYEGSIDMAMCECYAYMDLAISEKETADYTALVTAARHRVTGKIYMVDPVRIRGSITEQLKLVFDYYAKWHHKLIGIEIVGYQKAFLQLLQLESNKRNIYIPVRGIEIDRDKIRRALEISVHVENGTVEFSNSNQEYLAEIIQFPKASHDDWVDATVESIKLALSTSVGTVLSGSGVSYPKNI